MKLLHINLIFLLTISLYSCKPPACPIPTCEVRMKHRHGGEEFRGLPWWKRNKNPKYGQDYKDPFEKDKKLEAKQSKERRKKAYQKKKESRKQ